MRSIAAACSALLLAACGSAGSTSPSPVETMSDSGDVAAATSPCPEGPPASGSVLRIIDSSPEHDGTVGTIANRTGRTIYLAQFDAPLASAQWCSVADGQRAAYAMEQPTKLLVTYQPLAKGSGDSWSPPFQMVVWAEDPAVGSPDASIAASKVVAGPTTDICWGSTRETTLSEGDRVDLTTSYASATVIRHDDDRDIARQWTGVDSWAVNDWARIDFEVTAVPEDRC